MLDVFTAGSNGIEMTAKAIRSRLIDLKIIVEYPVDSDDEVGAFYVYIYYVLIFQPGGLSPDQQKRSF